MFNELKKLFGMDYNGPAPVAPVPQQVASQMGDIPQQPRPSLWGQLMDDKPLSAEEMPGKAESLGAVAKDIVGFTQDVGGTLLDAGSHAVDVGVGKAVDIGANIEAGYTGVPRTDVPDYDPGTRDQREYADAMLKKQAAIKGLTDKQPAVKNILDTASTIDPAVFDAVPAEQQAEVKKAGDIAVDLLLSNEETDPKTVMESAAGFLGGLFEDKAIQQALIYYTGARLMGYSGSGSGSVLLQGWANQDKKDLLTQTATAKAADKKSANDALDMSKTVTMWDPKAKQPVAGYMSKSGKFQSAAGGEVVNAKDYGLESYDKARHKTFDGIDLENIDYINGASDDVLDNISNNSEIYSIEQRQTAQSLFGDGSAIQEAYAVATRSARANGVDTSTPQYRTALGNSVRKYMMNTIKNPTDKFSGTLTAGLADAIRADQLKADLTTEGGVPKFVFGKATWNADGIETMEEGYELPNAAVSKLMKQVDNINSGLVKVATEGKHSAEKIRTLITPTKTLQKLSKIFKDTVMQDPEARAHWTKVGEKSNTNAMNAWLASSGSDTDPKYLGINNPAVNAKFHTLYNKKFKE